MSSRSRRDIQTAVSFLNTRFKSPDKDDCGKIKYFFKYLKVTKYIKLILSVDAMAIIKWWVMRQIGHIWIVRVILVP